MKKYCFLLIVICIGIYSCDPPPQYHDTFVKLQATINDSSETIHLGDTLKFDLTLPDTLFASTQTGFETIPVNSVQRVDYPFCLYLIDTTSSTISVKRINGNQATFATNGTSDDGVQVRMAVHGRPYTVTLNVVPPSRGLYNLYIPQMLGNIGLNNRNQYVGLALNFKVRNKHWYLFDPYNPGFSDGIAEADYNGFGCYLFRVK